jgi:hypothetical protein
MPYDAPGKRKEVTWHGGSDGKTPIRSNTFAVVDNKVLLLTKTEQLDRFVRPESDEATFIQPAELCVGFEGGVHELALDNALGLGGVTRDDKLWIDSTTSAILTSPGGGTGGANEVQKIQVIGSGGGFKLLWTDPDGNTNETATIKFNASAAEVQAALEATPSIDPGDVTVTGGPGDLTGTTPYSATFAGRYSKADVAALTATDTLTGGEEKVVITTTTPGVGSGDEVYPLGVVDEIDATRTPHVARVSTDSWHAFIIS